MRSIPINSEETLDKLQARVNQTPYKDAVIFDRDKLVMLYDDRKAKRIEKRTKQDNPIDNASA